MRWVPGAALVALLLVASAGAPPAAAQQGTEGAETTMRLQLQADGDGRWVVTTRIPLEDEADRAAFEETREEFLDGDSDMERSLGAFRNAAAAASAASDRQMNVTRVSRTARVIDAANASGNTSVGVLELSFTWTDFARRHNDTVVVSDAFNTTGGTWLPALTEGQTLVIEPPRGYGVDDAPLATDPDSLDDGVLTWSGPQEFDAGDLTITYVRGAGNGGESFWEGLVLPGYLLPLALTGAGLLAIVLGVVLRNRYRDGQAPAETPGGAASSDGGSGASDATSGGASDGTAGAASDPEAVDEDPGADDEGDPAGQAAAVDPELLSDEERVHHLLEQNGGRMKQANIVTETGWSNAKVSQLLSGMAEEGEIEKLRIGRENLISLPGREPGIDPDGGSDHDDSAD